MKDSGIRKGLTNPWIALVLIAVVTVAIYSNIYSVPFVFDGTYQIEDNSDVRDFKMFLSPKAAFYPRPLCMLTYALNYRFGKLDVFGYHLVNVFIHIINGFLVYFLALNIFKELMNSLAQRFGHSNSSSGPKSKVQGPRSAAQGSQPAVFQSRIDNQQPTIFLMSLFIALIFVAHPIQTQAVTYIAQRYTSMAAMFYFLSVFCYVRARILQQGSGSREQRAVNSGQWSGIKQERKGFQV